MPPELHYLVRLLVAAILYELGKSWWADRQKHKKPEYPPSWLD